MSTNEWLSQKEAELLGQASALGVKDDLLHLAKHIQNQLSADGDQADWYDCLEMAYNELISNDLY